MIAGTRRRPIFHRQPGMERPGLVARTGTRMAAVYEGT
jgi:hypothetical protein